MLSPVEKIATDTMFEFELLTESAYLKIDFQQFIVEGSMK